MRHIIGLIKNVVFAALFVTLGTTISGLCGFACFIYFRYATEVNLVINPLIHPFSLNVSLYFLFFSGLFLGYYMIYIGLRLPRKRIYWAGRAAAILLIVLIGVILITMATSYLIYTQYRSQAGATGIVIQGIVTFYQFISPTTIIGFASFIFALAGFALDFATQTIGTAPAENINKAWKIRCAVCGELKRIDPEHKDRYVCERHDRVRYINVRLEPALLGVTEQPHRPLVLRFDPLSVRKTVGTAPDSDAVIDPLRHPAFTQVERTHVKIRLNEGRFDVLNQATKYPTQLNGMALEEGKWEPIHENDVLVLGKEQARFTFVQGDKGQMSLTKEALRIKLTIMETQDDIGFPLGHEFKLVFTPQQAVFVVGSNRNRDANIRFNSNYVSGKQIELIGDVTSKKVLVRNCSDKNETHVRGERLPLNKATPLGEDDVILLVALTNHSISLKFNSESS